MAFPSSEASSTRILERRLKGLTKLVDLTCDLATERDLNRILHLVTVHVCEALDCERASLYLYDERTRELHTQSATELEIAEIRHSIDSGIAGWVARQREVANVSQPADDPRWNSAFDRVTGFRTESILSAPIISKHDDRLVGVLQLLNKHEGPFDDFDERLLLAFSAHAAVALEQARLLEDLRHSQMLDASIALARKIQASFLPARLPNRPGYDLAAWWQPAEAVAGDYYDVIPLSDGHLALAMADVSGHGVGPSLIMAAARAMLHVFARRRTEPGQILTMLSETISPDLNDGRFITFFLAALDTDHHTLTFANAGHFPALHYRRRLDSFDDLRTTGLPLGVWLEVEFPPGMDVSLEPGDIIVLATDGAIEQHSHAREMFGVERLKSIVSANHDASASELIGHIRAALAEFFTSEHPDDDISVLIVKRESNSIASQLDPTQP